MNTKLKQIQDWTPLARQAEWTVSRLARLCGVSVRTLERHFLKSFGQSPEAWMTKQKHKQAAELLHDQSSVKETASLVGYAHATTFAREFKKQTGLCPHVLAKPPVKPGQEPRSVA